MDNLQKITITKPDDWHLHIRSGNIMNSVVNMSAKQMGRAIIMPNLVPAIKNVQQAKSYYKEIINALKYSDFKPLMTIYLTDNTSVKDIIDIKESKEVYAAKLYPVGVTTNSDFGVTGINKIYRVLEAMQKYKIPLLVHGEINNPEIDIFDREAVFIETVLTKIIKDFPELKIVLEHISTKEAVDFVLNATKNIAATITPHHLLANRNNMLSGGIKPHYYCLPILKSQNPHQKALIEAATSASENFFLGTDSAPHERHKKESSCGCAGVFNAYAAIELYAMAFDGVGEIKKLENFASKFGSDFYGLKANLEKITLVKKSWQAPAKYDLAGLEIVPFLSEQNISWKIIN